MSSLSYSTRRRQLLAAVVVALTSIFSASLVAESLLIENATILSLADASDKAYIGYMRVDDDVITALGAGKYEGGAVDRRIDAESKIIMPGFVSGHNHLWQSAFRGLAADKELYGWLEALHWTYGAYFGDGDFYSFTLHGALDQLQHGITTSYNHSQRLSATEAQYLESFQAELDAGQHFVFSYNADLTKTNAEAEKAIEGFIKYSRSYIGKSVFLAPSIHSVGAYFGADKLALEMKLAKKYKLTAQIHYLEEYNRRFIDRKKWPLFKSAGAVADGVSFAHFIHTTDDIIRDTAAADGGMIWNPLSNGRLASGLADIPKYLAMGVKVGMGVDGAASADIADPFENMRMGMYGLRMLHKNANVMLPIDVLRLHTLRTAEVIQVSDRVGSLEPGKQADFLIVDPGRPGTGAVFDVPATLVFACNAQNIEAVYVAGKLRVSSGAVIGFDSSELQRDVVQRVARISAAAAANLH